MYVILLFRQTYNAVLKGPIELIRFVLVLIQINYECLQEAHTGLSDVTEFESDESRESCATMCCTLSGSKCHTVRNNT